MAYQSYAITNLGAAIPLVSAWAATNGWTVDTTNSAAPIFTHPSLSGAIPLQLSSIVDGLKVAPVSGTSLFAKVIRPQLSQGNAIPFLPPPTALHVFSSQTPAPYIAIVLEFGFNSFRHLYLGYLEPLGGITGGEVIGCATPYASANYGAIFSSTINQYLFGGRSNAFGGLDGSGGVHFLHASNPSPWRSFGNPNHGILGAIPDTEAYGGFLDDVNDGFIQSGKSPFGGINILVPANLYAVRNPGASVGFAPIGRPAGVRMVNMQDLEPGGQIVVGATNWRVFPAYSKNSSLYQGSPSAGTYPTFESSYYVGYAYPET